MKLRFSGHDCRYVIEQGLLSLFPEERPTYGEIDPEQDARWAEVSLRSEADRCFAETRLGWDGRIVRETAEAPSPARSMRGRASAAAVWGGAFSRPTAPSPA